MLRLIRHSRVILACVILSGFAVYSNSQAETGIQTLGQYFDLVMSGNYESAQQYWTDESQRRSGRFGIEYINIPLKIDCASPAVRNTDLLRKLPPNAVTEATRLASDDYVRYTLELEAGDTKLTHYYYTYNRDGYYWLMFPQDYISQGWPEIETKYLLIKYHPETEKSLNALAVDEFDRFIKRVADSLGLSKEDMKLLEKEKIRYYLCQNDTMVKDMTGFLIKGTYDLASDDVISSFFPHYHELTHFLVNYKLRKLHLYTLPIMREGIAVYMAGRWGKAPISLLALGGSIYQQGIVQLDSILTMTGFEKSAGSDLAYPLAGLFTAFLRSRMSFDDYLELYRKVSGDFEDLYRLLPGDIKGIIMNSLGESDWEKVRAQFDFFVFEWMADNAGIYPGNTGGGKTAFESPMISITKKDGWVSVRITDTTGNGPEGNILIGKTSDLDGKVSSLFEEQYKTDETLDSYRYGIRFDRNEAGVYDYATNHLLAKYIWGITPSEDYYSEQEKTLYLKFRQELIGDADINGKNIRVLAQ